jgi:hypothetical protein
MRTIKINSGKKTATIQVNGFTTKELINQIHLAEKKKKESKIKHYQYLTSVSESEDKKSLIFNFSNKTNIKYSLINNKFYDAETNTLIKNPNSCIKFASGNLSGLARDKEIYKLCKEEWTQLFFIITSREDYYLPDRSDLFSILNNPVIMGHFEKFAKWDFLQKNKEKLYRLEFEKIYFDCDIKTINDFKNYSLDYYIEKLDTMVAEDGDYNYIKLGDCVTLDWWINAKNIDVIKYAIDNYNRLPDMGGEYSNRLIKMGYDKFKLTDYICRGLPNQGIEEVEDGLSILHDYARMNVQMKNDFDKYPRYLKTLHDITSKNYEVLKNKTFKSRFSKVCKTFKKYEYKNEKYSVITPAKHEDLIQEGIRLNHCVASYADDIADKISIVLFLRLNSEIQKPLVTIEIKGNKIIQAKGHSNSNPKNEEKIFLEEYKNYLKGVK